MSIDNNRLKWKPGLIIIVVILIVIATALPYIKKRFFLDADGFVAKNIIGEEGKVTTITESTLEEVIKRSQLYTAEYPYNGYVTVSDEKGKVKYYAAYEGTVKAGIDVSRITVTLHEETNTIVIQLPEVQVEEPVVDAGKMEYIFAKEKYNTEMVAAEAYKYAEEDLANKVREDADIRAYATESAKAAEKAMVEPWINQIDKNEKYTVLVLGYGEEYCEK